MARERGFRRLTLVVSLAALGGGLVLAGFLRQTEMKAQGIDIEVATL